MEKKDHSASRDSARNPLRDSVRNPAQNPRAMEIEEKRKSYVVHSGRTVEELTTASRMVDEELYLEAFARGLSLVYVDERCHREREMILARPDGGEDLILYHPESAKKEFLRELKPAGEGKYGYLIADPRMESYKAKYRG